MIFRRRRRWTQSESGPYIPAEIHGADGSQLLKLIQRASLHGSTRLAGTMNPIDPSSLYALIAYFQDGFVEAESGRMDAWQCLVLLLPEEEFVFAPIRAVGRLSVRADDYAGLSVLKPARQDQVVQALASRLFRASRTNEFYKDADVPGLS